MPHFENTKTFSKEATLTVAAHTNGCREKNKGNEMKISVSKSEDNSTKDDHVLSEEALWKFEAFLKKMCSQESS
jgi:hypothetical protein